MRDTLLYRYASLEIRFARDTLALKNDLFDRRALL